MIRRIFYSSDVEFVVYQANGKTLTYVKHFQADIEGQQQFAEYIRQDLRTPVAWLVDTTQEGYQINFLPHVFGWDRYNLLMLRKQRLFEYTPYSYAVIQGRESQGRRDDRVLFMALNSAALLQPWLDIVLGQGIPITSICSLPLLSQCLIKYFPESPHTLLVTHTPRMSAYSTQGLRQSFFLNHQLQLSRLIPLDSQDTLGYADYVINQIVKTQHYLESARLLPVNTNLSVVLLTQPPLSQLLNKQLSHYKNEELQFHLIDSRELAAQIGIETEETPLHAHHLVIPQLTRWWIPNHYARFTEIRYLFYSRFRFALYTLSALILASGVAMGGMNIQNALKVQQDKQKLLLEKENVKRELNRLQIPSLPADVRLIRNIVDVGRYLEAQHISPEEMWIDVSSVLTQHAELKINHLEWGIGKVPEEIFQTTLPAKYLNLGGKQPPTDDAKPIVEQKMDEGDFLEGMRLYGEIESFYGDYQIALEKYNKFIRDLKNFGKKTWTINPLILPYQTGAQKIIKGTIQQQLPVSDKKALFAIEILITHRYVPKS